MVSPGNVFPFPFIFPFLFQFLVPFPGAWQYQKDDVRKKKDLMLKVQCPLEVSSWSFKCKLKMFEIIIYGNFQLNLQMMFLGLHLSNREDVEYYEVISTINFSIQFFVELTSACWPRSWVVHLSDTKVICLFAYDFFGSQYVQRYTSQLIMYVLYTEIGHSVRLRV